MSHFISLPNIEQYRNTVNAVNFAGLIVRVWQHKNIRGLLNSRWADTHLIFLYRTNTWHHTTIHLQAAGQHKNKAGLTHSPVYYPFASTHMVNSTQLLRVQNVHTNYRIYFRGFLNSRLLNFARKLMCRKYLYFYSITIECTDHRHYKQTILHTQEYCKPPQGYE